MAVVNVDLSEYDAIRKRNSELEEQVKELKKLNESLKQGAKVILRNEVVIETVSLIEPDPWRDSQIIGFHEDVGTSNKRIVKSSESYVNFEDVRLKVENAMQDEVKRSIHDRDCERQSYADAKSKLDNEYNLKKADLEKEYKNKAEDLERDNHRKECDFESEKLRILNLLPNIRKLAEELHDDLNNRFFKPKHAIELANSIISTTTKKW